MEIIYHPAECDINCDISDCHLMHTECWSVGNKIFSTYLEADNYVEDQLTIKVGDELTKVI